MPKVGNVYNDTIMRTATATPLVIVAGYTLYQHSANSSPYVCKSEVFCDRYVLPCPTCHK